MTEEASQNQKNQKQKEKKKSASPRVSRESLLRAKAKIQKLPPIRKKDSSLGNACDELLPDVLRAINRGRTPEEIYALIKDDLSCPLKTFERQLKRGLRQLLVQQDGPEGANRLPELWAAMEEGRASFDVDSLTDLRKALPPTETSPAEKPKDIPATSPASA